MTRSFLSFTFALATATPVLHAAVATVVFCQPANDSAPPAEAELQQYPELQEAVELLFDKDMAIDRNLANC